MGKAISKAFRKGLRFGAEPPQPLSFQPKAKDESNKLRRKNSLYESIVVYNDALVTNEGIASLVDSADLAAAQQKIKKDPPDDPRIAAVNKIADEVRCGNMRTLRNQITNHFKTVNRRYQGKHSLNSLLHIASREGFLPMVKVIFDDSTRIPADREVPIFPNTLNQRNRTPLHEAFSPPTRTWSGMTYGIENDASKAKSTRPEGIQLDSDWIRPGNVEQRIKLVELLIAEGSNYEVKDIQDFRALHYACVWGWSSVVEKLLSMDCDIAPKTTNGATPLMFACARDHLKVVKLLLSEEEGEAAEVEAQDSQGDTALLLAIRRGSVPIASLLVETFDANVNVENFKKDTPLMAACAINNLDIVNLLLDNNVERDPAAFEMLRGVTAAMIRKRLEIESGTDKEAKRGQRPTRSAVGCWVLYIEKPMNGTDSLVQKKRRRTRTKAKYFYYNYVSRRCQRIMPEDYEVDRLHIPREATYGLNFYH